MPVKWCGIMHKNCNYHKTGPARRLSPPASYKKLSRKTLHPLEPFERGLLVSCLILLKSAAFQAPSRPRGAAWASAASSTAWCGSPASSGIWVLRWPPCWMGWSASWRRRRSSTPCSLVSGSPCAVRVECNVSSGRLH